MAFRRISKGKLKNSKSLLLHCSSALLLYCSAALFLLSLFLASRFTLHGFTLHEKLNLPYPSLWKEGFLLCVIFYLSPFVKGELKGGFSAALLLYCSAALLLYCSIGMRYGLFLFLYPQILQLRCFL